jgi:hypothetical protein
MSSFFAGRAVLYDDGHFVGTLSKNIFGESTTMTSMEPLKGIQPNLVIKPICMSKMVTYLDTIALIYMAVMTSTEKMGL